MKNIFCPNGMNSSTVIECLARKEFGNKISATSSYVELKREIIKVLRKMPISDLEENRLKTLVDIKHIEENDFGNFISVRFAYWGMILAIAVMVIDNAPIYSYFDISKRSFVIIIICSLVVLLVTMSRTIHIQHDELEYLNFKLICFDELLGNKRK